MIDGCACGSKNFEEATLMGAGLQPVRASAFRKTLAAAQITVRVCMDCGAFDRLKADPKTLKKMLGDKAK